MNTVGDLCHHTDKAVTKSELWITDQLGFRNDEFVKDPDILFLGDSFIAGAALSQDDIISNKVKSKINKSVYNMSPCTFSFLDFFIRNDFINKPKVIIYSLVERNNPRQMEHIEFSFIDKVLFQLSGIGNMNIYIDKAFRFSAFKWFKARIKNSKGFGIPSKIDSDMFFLQGASAKYDTSTLARKVRIIKEYKKYCDSLNIKFIVMPMPNKETVYYELVPFEQQPQYLFQFDSLLRKENITTINTLKLYNDYRQTNANMLYHLDDTHWNSNATELVSNEIIKLLK